MQVKDLDLKIPWVGGAIETKIPVTAKSSWIIMVTFCMTVMITVIMCSYIIFVEGNSENVHTVTDIFGTKPVNKPTITSRTKATTTSICECPEQDRTLKRLRIAP